ncbi:DNA polymerase III subunit delta' [Caldovatus sediminis]|uniref:DNA polymerase III subunit delta n=1 Tax=Caldovatus sediminis TaxID=2041189 RepID=A0A8J2Z8B2_9PROT|nr:DNA polymerase III subunit delta' [Caldovatus sediminis]GGG21931.1 DNA polymerase III subunit delta' [Caldovatus sediminis]
MSDLPPEPRANPDLAGHDHAARALEQAARSGRLHHAWLLAGPPGVGKATLAYRFARWLLAGPPPGEGAAPLALDPRHPVFRRVAAGAHADLLAIEPGTLQGSRKRADVINVDAARLIPAFMALTAAEGGWRVVVIDGAETMAAPAANALLKILEEPPPRAVLLVLTAAPGRLLPTIRSRCRRLDLFPLADAELLPLLARWLPDMAPGERQALACLAGGSPGRALALAEEGGLALQALVEEVLAGLARRPDPRQAHAVADRLAAGGDAAAFLTFFALLRQAIAAAIRLAARDAAAAPAWVARRPLAEWSALWDRLGRLAAETDALNLDRRQAVLTGLGWLSAPGRD